jgi:MFS family permease
MAAAASLYMVGFGLFGLAYSLVLFAFAIMLITIGEMIAVPTGQALAARLAPESYRGRYMAFYGLAWSIPSAVGPSAAGLIFDNFDPNWVWYICAILCSAAVVGFLALHWRTHERFGAPAVDKQPVADPG